MRIVFMGTPDFSVAPLKALIEGGHEILAVVTQPAKPKGRGKSVQMTPVKEEALSRGIAVYQPVKVREPEFIQVMKDLAPDVIVVVAFGQIIPQAILDLPPYGCINIHASLLPKYRGAAPIQWAVIDGEKETGITTMQMDAGLDTGAILEQERVTLAEDETGGSLFDKLSAVGSSLILSTLEKLEAGTITLKPQPSEGSTYAGRLTKELGDIDWSKDAVSIERLIRGLNPWPSAYTRWKGKTVKLWAAKALPQDTVKEMGEYEKGAFGQIVRCDRHCLTVQTGEGLLDIRELQLEGKKRMDVEAFLRGCPMAVGDVFERRMINS